MDTTETNDTIIAEMMQTLMNEGMQGFPSVMARMYNLAMQFERELHLGAGRYERTEERRGYANGYKPKTLSTAAARQFLRTNNMEENLNRQIKQRTRLIPAFPNIDSLLRLVSAICAEISDDWETNSYRYMSTIKEL